MENNRGEITECLSQVSAEMKEEFCILRVSIDGLTSKINQLVKFIGDFKV